MVRHMLLLPGLTQCFRSFFSLYFSFYLNQQSISSKQFLFGVCVFQSKMKSPSWKYCMLKSKHFQGNIICSINSTPFWTQNWTNLFENEFSLTCLNVYFTCFQLKKYYLKKYPIHVVSLSQSPRSKSYPIYNLFRNSAW